MTSTPLSILDTLADCIVNAANSHLVHSGSIARVIADAAGPIFQSQSNDFVKQHGPVAPGTAIIGDAFDLSRRGIKKVVHAVALMWSGGDSREDWLLFQAVLKVLDSAVSNGCHSISVSAIGIFRCDKTVAVHAIVLATLVFPILQRREGGAPTHRPA